MKWGAAVGEAAAARNWYASGVSYSQRVYGDTYKKQKTNPPGNDGWDAWNYNNYQRTWIEEHWRYDESQDAEDANLKGTGSSYGRGSSDSSWQVVEPISVKP